MGAIITKIGLKKIAGATVDNPLKIEKFALGDGGGKEIIANADMKSLVGEKYRDLINDKYANNNKTVFESVLRANAKIEKGFYIRELGLFDEEGDLIVVTDVPLQYRAATKEGNILTELLFNVVIQVDNAEVIEIKLNEQVVATVDMMNRILSRVEKLEVDKSKLIEASVGIDKWFNTDNSYRDQNIVTIGIKTWALMDESNILSIADYPILFRNIKGVDRGDGTFAMTKFYNGTTRHMHKGSGRILGCYEEDSLQAHTHSNTHRHMMHPHNHPIDDIRGEFGIGQAHGRQMEFSDLWAQGAFARMNGGWKSHVISWNYYGAWECGHYEFSSHGAGVKTTNMATSTMHDTSITTDEGNARKSEETRMKNTSGQWYILAKVNI